MTNITRRFTLGALVASAMPAAATVQREYHENLSNEEFGYLLVGMYVSMPAAKRATARQKFRDEGMPDWAWAFERIKI